MKHRVWLLRGMLGTRSTPLPSYSILCVSHQVDDGAIVLYNSSDNEVELERTSTSCKLSFHSAIEIRRSAISCRALMAPLVLFISILTKSRDVNAPGTQLQRPHHQR